MSRTTAKAVEAWDLSEVLAALCQVTQGAGDAESVPEVGQKPRIAPDLPATDQEESRP